MFKKFPAARRVLIYVVLSYIALVSVNNSGLEYENMWLIYAPMFVGIYLFSRWVDSRFSSTTTNVTSASKSDGSNDSLSTRGFGD